MAIVHARELRDPEIAVRIAHRRLRARSPERRTGREQDAQLLVEGRVIVRVAFERAARRFEFANAYERRRRDWEVSGEKSTSIVEFETQRPQAKCVMNIEQVVRFAEPRVGW